LLQNHNLPEPKPARGRSVFFSLFPPIVNQCKFSYYVIVPLLILPSLLIQL
jgi:hypothetical protein